MRKQRAQGVSRRRAGAGRHTGSRVRAVIDGLGPSMFVGLLTPTGTVVEANAPGLKATGLTRQAVLGQPFADFWPWTSEPGIQQQVREAIDRAARGESSRYDVEALTADARPIVFDFSLEPLRDAQGRVQFLVASAVIITGRREAEAALLESEEKFSKAFRDSAAMIVLTTLDGKNVDFNQAYADFVGYSREEMLGKNVADLEIVTPQERRRIVALIQKAGGHLRNVEIPVHSRGGTLHVLFSADTMSLHGVPHRLITMLDISDLKRADAALLASEARTQLLIRAANVGLWDWDLATNDIFFSPELKHQLGYADDELPNRYDEWESRLHPADRADTLEAVKNYVGGRSPDFDAEFRMRHKDGSWRWILSRAELVRDAVGTPVRMRGCHIDVTERRQATEGVRRAGERLQALSRQLLDVRETERRQLARELHDEIGQVLTAAKINLQSLQLVSDPAAIRARLDESVAIVDRALTQVRARSLELHPPLLDDLGLSAALRWLTTHHATRARLHLTFHSAIADTRFDSAVETACFRIAQEALNNIVKHAGARHLSVTLQAESGRLHLRVHDDGVGFDVVAARRRAAEGASLGLLGMEERATLVGGTIAWQSQPGLGTKVVASFALGSSATPGTR